MTPHTDRLRSTLTTALSCVLTRVLGSALAFALLPAAATTLRAQSLPAATSVDSATLRVTLLHDSTPVADAVVRSGSIATRSDDAGLAVLRLPAGTHALVITRIGFAPERRTLLLAGGADTSITVALTATATDVETIVIAATRSGRRIEDEPVRVEVLEREEIEEKMLMTPGDITMMLNETSGLRVQTTSPSLGGANVRIQGLRGHYTQMLSDGLPLYGGQTGGLGLLQIPPMDLQQVEVIKGAASSLYGSQALGGVINLVSRTPAAEGEREFLLNQTTRGGTDGVLWLSGPISPTWGYTLLTGAHRQERRDIDDDGWTDLAGYERLVVRPRLFWDDGTGRSLFVTIGSTTESRRGGTLPGRTAPDAQPFAEALSTRRLDLGVKGSLLLGSTLLQLRGSGTEQRHDHRFGTVPEGDTHRTGFVEMSLRRPGALGTWVAGVAAQGESYANRDVAGFDFDHAVGSLFGQLESDPATWLSLSASARLDAHDTYGTTLSPRLSALFRAGEAGRLAGWTLRTSVASGTFAPTPFTEETEVTGLAMVQPGAALRRERALTGSADLNGRLLGLEVNATLFASVVEDPVEVTEVTGGAFPPMLRLSNAVEPTRTQGAELLARWRHEGFAVTGSYTFIRGSLFSTPDGARAPLTLVPRHAVGVVAMHEVEDVGRMGLELYHTGRQALEANPYRAASRPYLIVGFLVERHVGPARLFLNAENLGDVRQTRWDPLVRPVQGAGGRWTTDAWTELSGRTFNGGVRLAF